jgi:hypothetical protein
VRFHNELTFCTDRLPWYVDKTIAAMAPHILTSFDDMKSLIKAVTLVIRLSGVDHRMEFTFPHFRICASHNELLMASSP